MKRRAGSVPMFDRYAMIGHGGRVRSVYQGRVYPDEAQQAAPCRTFGRSAWVEPDFDRRQAGDAAGRQGRSYYGGGISPAGHRAACRSRN